VTSVSRLPSLLCAAGCALAACSNNDGFDNDYETQSTLTVKGYVSGELVKLTNAAIAIQKAAPAPDDDGWNAQDDADAVMQMRSAWSDARAAYEHIEGSIAVLFMAEDVSTDERYDGFIATMPDNDLFDDQGVVGVHAIERVLWSDSIPARVVAFESSLDGYVAASFPTNHDEADEFKNKLCARLVSDIGKMRDEYASVALDSAAAFRGMIGSMKEQKEKTTLAASGEDESRYAQNTLADMRANLAGADAVFKAFRAWSDSVNGAPTGTKIQSGLDDIGSAYSAIDGVALPEVPETFNPDSPSDDDLATPYGKLWQLLNAQTDLNSDDSVISIMSKAADKMGIREE
jgi:iron uptake system component EfeO